VELDGANAFLPSPVGRPAIEQAALDAGNQQGKTIRCTISCAPPVGGQNEVRWVISLMEGSAPLGLCDTPHPMCIPPPSGHLPSRVPAPCPFCLLDTDRSW